ncbi:MAG: hypothetical protein ACJA1C_000823 [Crocinitomicaceae bacterium]|jgi:uncharacterized protein YycO
MNDLFNRYKMDIKNLFIVFVTITLLVGCADELETSIQSGDIVFQSTNSRQCKAVKLATNSKYSHVGIVLEIDGDLIVYEAVQPVKMTPLSEWIRHGENGNYVAKRLKNANEILTKGVLSDMEEIANGYLGKNYDIYFEWSDEKIYCSELVWKIYKEATGIEIGGLKTLKDFDLSSNLVQSIMEERYGNNIPLNEDVISPAGMFNSENLVLVEKK